MVGSASAGSPTICIAVTQRLEIDAHGQCRDALEHRYTELISRFGANPLILPNNSTVAAALIDTYRPQRVLLTGGGDIDTTWRSHTSSVREQVEGLLIDYACTTHTPLLGICRGMQYLNVYFGGSLTRMNTSGSKLSHPPPGSQHSLSLTNPALVARCDGISAHSVNSFHDWGITKVGLSEKLVPFALSEDGVVEGLFLSGCPLAGVQWHPEREDSMSPLSYLLMEAFFNADIFWKVHR